MYQYKCPMCGHCPLSLTTDTGGKPICGRCDGCGKAYPYMQLNIERVGRARTIRRELLASDGQMTYSLEHK